MHVQKPRVLYIEDHEDTRELVTLCLSQKSYEVVTSATIERGIALASAERFDLYLLDSWLPDGSGLDLCEKIREFDKTTPILFYSAAAYSSDHEMALQCGAQAYLIKPSQPADLCKLVSELIEDSRRESSGRQIAHRIIPDKYRTAAVAAVSTSQNDQYD
jgi:DNA-binding response OmpR family regulator